MDKQQLSQTNARIKTQRLLKSSAQIFRSLDKKLDKFEAELRKKSITGTMSRRRLLLNECAAIDMFVKGRLAYKDVQRQSGKSSKHNIHYWLFLQLGDKVGLEDKLFQFGEIILSSKTPQEPSCHPLNTYVRRHALERIIERLGKSSLESALKILAPFVETIQLDYMDCIQSSEDDKFIFITEDLYVVVRIKRESPSIDDYTYEFTTVIPRKIWSKRRLNLLEEWTNLLKILKGKAPKYMPILVIKPSEINGNGSKINEDNCTVLWV